MYVMSCKCVCMFYKCMYIFFKCMYLFCRFMNMFCKCTFLFLQLYEYDLQMHVYVLKMYVYILHILVYFANVCICFANAYFCFANVWICFGNVCICFSMSDWAEVNTWSKVTLGSWDFPVGKSSTTLCGSPAMFTKLYSPLFISNVNFNSFLESLQTWFPSREPHQPMQVTWAHQAQWGLPATCGTSCSSSSRTAASSSSQPPFSPPPQSHQSNWKQTILQNFWLLPNLSHPSFIAKLHCRHLQLQLFCTKTGWVFTPDCCIECVRVLCVRILYTLVFANVC